MKVKEFSRGAMPSRGACSGESGARGDDNCDRGIYGEGKWSSASSNLRDYKGVDIIAGCKFAVLRQIISYTNLSMSDSMLKVSSKGAVSYSSRASKVAWAARAPIIAVLFIFLTIINARNHYTSHNYLKKVRCLKI